MSKRLLALLLVCVTLCTGALGEETMDWTDYEAVLSFVREEAPQELALGRTKFTLPQLLKLKRALPAGAEMSFTMYLCKSWIESTATVVDLDQDKGLIQGEDLETLLELMPQVTQIDAFTHQNLDNETMMPLVDRYPQVRFGWLVRLGKKYKIRSDATAFSTRKGPKPPFYTSEDLEVLRYVPGLRAIDVGHNHVDDLSFLTHFPDLRLLILADNNVTDLTPLAQLKELEYVELFMNDVTDLSPLAGLTKLVDLNLCHNQVTDLSPLKDLPLERFYCSYNPVSEDEAQTERFEAEHPDCETNWLVYSSTGAQWRENYKFEQYRRMFVTRIWTPFQEP